MKKYIINLFFLLFAITAFTQETGSISGTVTDKETGEVISNAEVQIAQTTKGVFASENGNYEINNISPGTYKVKVHALGYKMLSDSSVKIEAGKTTVLNLEMKPVNIELDEAIITVTKINKSVKRIGSPVYIMGLKEIERTEGRNVEEALVKIPGVYTEDRYHNETNIVSFRGVGLHTHVTSGILVLVDGVSLTESMGRTDFEGVDLENAEKIEVLKGPVSALYGPNGITGVINIVEKMPKEGIHAKAKASYGSFNSMSFSGDVNGGKNGFRYLVKGKYFDNGGYMDRSKSTSARGGIKLIQRFDNSNKLQFTADYVDADMLLPGTLSREDFDNRVTEASNLYAGYERNFLRTNLAYTQDINDKINVFTNAYYRTKNDEGHYSDRSFSKGKINTVGGEVRGDIKHNIFNKSSLLTLGISYLNDSNDDETFTRNMGTGELGDLSSAGNSDYNMFGAYVEEDFTVTDKLSFVLGARFDLIVYDWIDNLNVGEENTSASTEVSSISPKFGFAYNPTNETTVFGNIARGFRPPSVSQLFIGSSYAGAIANPDLKPEYLNNYELGVRGNLNKKFSYQTSFFMMNFTDQISAEIDAEIDPDNPVYQNIGKTKHKGLEIAMNYDVTEQFNTFFNYSYLEAKFDDNPDFENNTLRKTPNNILNTGLSYNFNFGLKAIFDFKFVDKYYMDNEEEFEYEGYSLANFKLLYKQKDLTLSVSVNNIFDTTYATYAYSSSSYNYITHQYEWDDKYITGWPINFNTSISYRF